MKKFTKISLIVCLVLVCISAVCLGAGLAMGSSLKEVWSMAEEGQFNIGNWNIGRDHFYWGTDDGEELQVLSGVVQECFPAEEIDRFEMALGYGEIQIIDSTTKNIEVFVDAPQRNTYICKNDKGTLKLKDRTSGHHGNTAHHGVVVTVAIPEGKVFEDVSLVTNAGQIEISHNIQADNAEIDLDAGELTADSFQTAGEFAIEVGAGHVSIETFTARDLDVECGVGTVEMRGEVSGEAEADCGVGQITMELRGDEKSYDYEVNCGLGEVSINDRSYTSLSDDMNIDNGAGRTVSLECGVGQIDLTVEEE